MTYFKDLTPYPHGPGYESPSPNELNIGWLSDEVPFEKGSTSQEFKDKLLKFCSDEFIVYLAKGFHACEFCGLSWTQWHDDQKDKYGKNAYWASIGDGEIRVLGKSVVYAAPALVYHYVIEHQYKPPDEFIEAILAGEPDSKEQKELFRKYS